MKRVLAIVILGGIVVLGACREKRSGSGDTMAGMKGMQDTTETSGMPGMPGMAAPAADSTGVPMNRREAATDRDRPTNASSSPTAWW